MADFRERFTDAVGLESEVATLREIAARVPGLEEELSTLRAAAEQGLDHGEEHDDDDEPVIDLRHPECQSSTVRATPGGTQGES